MPRKAILSAAVIFFAVSPVFASSPAGLNLCILGGVMYFGARAIATILVTALVTATKILRPANFAAHLKFAAVYLFFAGAPAFMAFVLLFRQSVPATISYVFVELAVLAASVILMRRRQETAL